MQHKLLALAIASLFSLPTHAETADFLLDDVVVTATRTARTADEALQSVTVISRKEIESSHARDLIGLLDEHAGINLARNGGAGKITSIFMRGTATKHVLVLVDGVRAASATLGEYDWNALSPEQIERIEIVRGPRASLYGSDAIGGVIQIFTRKASNTEFQLTAGSNKTRSLSAAMGGGDDWRYSVEIGRDTTDGIPTFTTGTTAYGFQRNHATFGLEHEFSSSVSGNLRISQAWGRNEVDPDTGNNNFTNRTSSLRLRFLPSDQWTQTLILGHQLDRMESFSPYVPATIETSRNSLSWQHDLALSKGLLSLGLDYWNDNATKDQSGAIDESIRNTGMFMQYQLDSMSGEWQLGARHDQHEVFGGQNTWNISWGHEVGGGFRLTAAYGTAFKAPTVNDLFWPYSLETYLYDWAGHYFADTYITQGNTALLPETSKSSELGFRYQNEDLKVSANLFETRIHDLIEWTYDDFPGSGAGTSADPSTATYSYYPDNIGSARIRGMEFTAATTLAGWKVNASYTRLLATNLETNKQLDRRPANTLHLKSERTFGPNRLRFEFEVYSDRLDANGSQALPGYGLLHASYDYALDKDWNLGFRLENALDKDYATARTPTRLYDAPGRSIYLTLRYTPRK